MSAATAEFVAQCRERLQRIRAQIAEACARAHRDPADVEILAVTKGHPPWMLDVAHELGLDLVGENRVQDLLAKLDRLPAGMRVQFIGRLQSNKVNKLVGRVHSIASVDRAGLLEKIAHRAEDLGVDQRVWIQVNISDETQKGGCSPEQAAQLWRQAVEAGLVPVGLMGMGRYGAPEGDLRRDFADLRQLGADVGSELPDGRRVGLSMGMSGDYVIAVEEGSTQLRLGTALFGPRP
jgi:hypothetical protein